jgi:hypothetical protein
MYDIVVASEYARVYTLPRAEMQPLFPDFIVENMKANFKAKRNTRK